MDGGKDGTGKVKRRERYYPKKIRKSLPKAGSITPSKGGENGRESGT